MLAERLAGAGYRMVGVDPSQGMLDILAARTQLVRPVCASGTSLPFEDNTFELVITVAALHHIAEADAVRQTLAEMVRVVKPSGRVVVWDHNPRNPYWGPLMARVPQDTGEERLIPEAEIVTGLQASGGQIVLSKKLGAVPDFIPPRAMGLAVSFERVFEATPGLRSYAAHNAIVATK